MQGLVLNAEQRTATVSNDLPIPLPASNEIQVKVIAVALNPVDALYTANPLGKLGRIVGSDFAGTVSALGSNVKNITLGQRVAGFLQGASSVNDRPGAFAEYLVVPFDLVWLVPDDVSFAEAATVSLCALTAAQALFPRLGLPTPFSSSEEKWVRGDKVAITAEPLKILIYGASTSVGLNAAQLIHRSSQITGQAYEIYGVASSSHHEKLSLPPYNYTALVDYKDSDWPFQIQSLTGGKTIDFGYDCISEGESVANTFSTLKPGGKLAVVRSKQGKAWTFDGDTMPSKPIYGAVWEGLGEYVEYHGMTLPASPEAREFAVQFYRYISENPLVSSKVRLMPGGLERVVDDGFELLGPGTMGQREAGRNEDWMRPVRGEKLVYEIA